jgi:hypothetical protein
MINQEILPVREFRIKDEKGFEFGDLEAISIVSDPAHETTFQLFNKFKPAELHPNCRCEIIDGKIKTEGDACDYCKSIARNNLNSIGEKLQITGAAMVPNKKMLRQDEVTKEYYMGWFSEKTIEDCAKNYFKKGRNRQANLEHLEEFSKDFYVFESWIVNDPENDKANALGFTDIVKGTWFVTYQVSQSKWNEIKNGGYTGFSVEVDAALFTKEVSENEIKSIVFNTSMTDEEKELKLRVLLK